MRRIIAFNEGERILILRRFVLVEGEDQIAVRGMAINACLGVKRLQTRGMDSTCVHEFRLFAAFPTEIGEIVLVYSN